MKTTSLVNVKVKAVTRNLVDSIMLDVLPRPAAMVDFGINSHAHWEALYYAVRYGNVDESQLDAALGNGPALTNLLAGAPNNPHKGLVFVTAYDGLLDDDGMDTLVIRDQAVS